MKLKYSVLTMPNGRKQYYYNVIMPTVKQEVKTKQEQIVLFYFVLDYWLCFHYWKWCLLKINRYN